MVSNVEFLELTALFYYDDRYYQCYVGSRMQSCVQRMRVRRVRLEISLGITKPEILRGRSQRREQAEIIPEREKGRDSMGRCSDQMDVVGSLNQPEKACWPQKTREARLCWLRELDLELDELSRR